MDSGILSLSWKGTENHMTMASKYHLTIRERYEDHSEDEFTGGSAVFSGDYEHKLDLDTAKTGETINVSYLTGIIIQSVTTDPLTVKLIVNRGASNMHNPDFPISVTPGSPAFVWDPLNTCQKTISLEAKEGE